MSTQIYRDADGEMFIVAGWPNNYTVHQVGPPIATARRKFNAVRFVMKGETAGVELLPVTGWAIVDATGALVEDNLLYVEACEISEELASESDNFYQVIPSQEVNDQ